MIDTKKVLTMAGFTEIPQDILKIQTNFSEVQNWIQQTDFNLPLEYYGLPQHNSFYKLFKTYKAKFDATPHLQACAFILHKYLFSPNRYNWTHNLKRTTIDPLPALILLSGHNTHQHNMQSRKFDTYQQEKHRFRIFETCIRGIDVYKIPGSEISQLIWGSLFINAHIVEFARLQFELFKFNYPIPNFTPKDQFCINIHVPRGDRLPNESVSKSLSYATEYIPQYFFEAPKKPEYFIDSWLMDKKLDLYLPEKSNIRLFRNRFEILHQLPESSLSKFLFNTSSSDISQYPSDTSLRQRIKNALQNGEKFHDGIAILKQEKTK